MSERSQRTLAELVQYLFVALYYWCRVCFWDRSTCDSSTGEFRRCN